jgi:thioredoxin-related protein
MDTVTDEIVSKYGKDVDFVSYTDTGDEGESLVKKYNVKKFPSNLIFDFKGNLVFRYDGLLDFRGVELQLIKQGISPYTAYNITPAAGVK